MDLTPHRARTVEWRFGPKDDPLTKFRNITAVLVGFGLMGIVGWASKRIFDPAGGVTELRFTSWAILAWIVVWLLSLGGLIYVLKRRRQIYYGVLEILFAIVSIALVHKVTVNQKLSITTADGMLLIVALFAFGSGFGNVVEGIEKRHNEEKLRAALNAGKEVSRLDSRTDDTDNLNPQGYPKS